VLPAGSTVGLVGELGAGKTTFVRGLARGLGVEDAVVSPTFTRMRELSGRLALYHFDAWRAGSAALLAEGGEFLGGDGVAVVEWADRVGEWLPLPRLELRLRHVDPERRDGGPERRDIEPEQRDLEPAQRELELCVLPARPGSGPAALALERALAAAVERCARSYGSLGLEPRKAREPDAAPPR